MRADRLLATLLLLQARGGMTARELAAELEVSERTVYRDMEALSAAGVPVYGQSGPEGGYSLLDSFRTRLTGLTAEEARALFVLSVPAPLERLGLDQHLRSALRKLAAELPASRRDDEARARTRFHLDAEAWREHEPHVPHMEVLHRAVWEDRRIRISYRPPFCEAIEQVVDPYGLVAKAGIWHLVCEARGRLRVHRVSELIDVQETDESFPRKPEFELAHYWRDYGETQESLLARYKVTVRISPRAIADLRRAFGRTIEASSERSTREGDGWIRVDLSFESLDAARSQLLGFGRGVEVLDPEPLRRSLVDYAEQIVDLYRT